MDSKLSSLAVGLVGAEVHSSNGAIQIRKDAAIPRGVGVLAPFFAARAENAEIWDVEGNRYIDFAAGVSVLNTGHRHPKVLAAVREQLERFTHTHFQIVPYESYVALAEKLNCITPGDYPKKTAFFTTGAEAVENAVKIARAATNRTGVIAFTGAFHGRSMMTMGLTGKLAPYKLKFGPFPGDIYRVPFPSELHGVSVAQSLHALQRLFKTDVEAQRVAAILIEPIQGEGGFYVAPAPFMQALREVCDQHGILLVVDEVQTGFGRTGKLFAIEHYGVAPDLIAMAKSLAGGLPLSAVTGRAELMDAPDPGGLGGTYAGNPLAIAAAHAVLDVIEEEGLVERANHLGRQLTRTLDGLLARVPHIAEVRGLGAMLGIEFMHPGTRDPDAAFAKRVQLQALRRGLILPTGGVYDNVIRFLFPLTISDSVFDEALSVLEPALLEPH